MLRSLMTITLSAGFILLSGTAFAQEAQDDGSLLPDIDPQDIEIRSQYRADFPGLRRQPILGFNPRPRVYQVDPNRRPFIEDYGDAVAMLPVGEVSRPDAPDYLPPLYPDPHTLFSRLGIGSFVSAESDIYASHEVAPGHWLNGGFNFDSSNGHLDDQESSFRFMDLTTGYRGKLNPSTVLGVNLGVNSNMNRMIEAEEPVATVMGSTARRELTGVNFGSRLQTFANTIEYWDIGLSGSYYSVNLDAMDFEQLSSEVAEWSVGGDISRTWAGSMLHETYGLGLDVLTGGYETSDSGSNSSWYMAGANGRYDRLFDYKTELDASLGAYVVGDAVNDQTFYIAPQINVEHFFMETITLFASASGRPEHPDQGSYHLENPFLSPENELQHSYHMKGSAGLAIEFFPGNILRGEASYQRSNNYSYYTREREELGFGLGSPLLYYQLNYMDATIFKLTAGFSMDIITDVIWVNSDVFWQKPELSTGDRIPFVENFGFHGALTLRPVSRLLLEAWGDFVGSRSNPDGQDLDPFLLIGTRVEVGINDRIGVYGKIQNLLNQEYEIWDGYRERPLQIHAGITFTL